MKKCHYKFFKKAIKLGLTRSEAMDIMRACSKKYGGHIFSSELIWYEHVY